MDSIKLIQLSRVKMKKRIFGLTRSLESTTHAFSAKSHALVFNENYNTPGSRLMKTSQTKVKIYTLLCYNWRQDKASLSSHSHAHKLISSFIKSSILSYSKKALKLLLKKALPMCFFKQCCLQIIQKMALANCKII